jgi:hypothetical protein
MASNKKPRKPYKQKPIHLPMMAESRDRMAMRLHLNVETLISSPSSEAFNELCKKVASLTDALSHLRGKPIVDDTDAAANAIRTMVMTLAQVQQRSERTKALGVTDLEAVSLRNASGVLDVEMGRIPKNVLDASILIVKHGLNQKLIESA